MIFIARLEYLLILPFVFVCLPVKSILRFRCVSKQWLFLIDDQELTTNHLHISRAKRRIYLYYQLYQGPPDCWHKPEYQVVGSCDGLLCFVRMGHHVSNRFQVICWNPSTKWQKKLPCNHDGYSGFPATVRFGFGSGTNAVEGFKVAMLAIPSRHPNFSSNAFTFCIYSSTTDSWRSIPVSPPFVAGIQSCGWTHYGMIQRGFPLVNGALHWLVRIRDGKKGFPNTHASNLGIVAFDLKTEEFRQITPPTITSSKRDRAWKYELHALEGKLCFCCYSTKGAEAGFIKRTEMWVMKDYGVQESWRHEAIVQEPARCHPKPLMYSKDRKNILFAMEKQCIWYSLSNQQTKLCPQTWEPTTLFEIYPFEESLVEIGGTHTPSTFGGLVVQKVPDPIPDDNAGSLS